MQPPDIISFNKIHAFHQKHSNVDLANSYFMGICTSLFPSVKSLSTFESTLAWKLSVSTKSFKLGKWEINNLAHFIHRLSKTDSGSVENVSFVTQLKKFEEKIEYWFKDFGAMKTLFPSFSNIQWFQIGAFMAEHTDVDLIFLLSTIENDFAFQTKDLNEQCKGKFLKYLLESNFEVLKKLNNAQSIPKIDIEKLKKSETQKKGKENQPPVHNSNSQQTPKLKDLQDRNLFFEALYNVKSAVIEPIKEKNILSTSQRGFPKTLAVKKPETECSICLEMIEENSATSLFLCQHSFHLECLQQYLNTRIDESSFPLICPMDKCSLKILGSEIPKLLDEEYKNKYHTFSLNRFIDIHPNEFFRCPGADCKKLACKDDLKSSFYCQECDKNYCVGCSNNVHDGMTCKEYEITMREDENDIKFLYWEKKFSCQKCSVCHYVVEKTEGCNHITCRCNHQFCYLCGAQWKTCPCEQFTRRSPNNGYEDVDLFEENNIFGD